MSLYYFLNLALPDLTLKAAPEMSFKEFRYLCEENLSSDDLVKFDLLLEMVDLYNIKALWMAQPLDERGRFKAKELEEALLIGDLLPSYVLEYLDRFESLQDRLKNFSCLYVAMYKQNVGGFVGRYFNFERNLRLVLLALRSKKYGKDLVQQLQFEDMQDPFVLEILSQRDASEFVPPSEFEEVKVLFNEYLIEPKRLDEALKKFRFEKISELEEIESFTVDKILSYAAKLLIVESWQKIDKEKEHLELEELSKYG